MPKYRPNGDCAIRKSAELTGESHMTLSQRFDEWMNKHMANRIRPNSANAIAD